MSFKLLLFFNGPLNVSHTRQPSPHISLELKFFREVLFRVSNRHTQLSSYHLVTNFNFTGSFFSGGSYISNDGGSFTGGI